MHNESERESIKDKVLTRIKSGQVAMRPKWHFALRAILAALASVIALLALLYLVSFVAFMLRETGVLFVPAFGFRGLSAFFASLPWVLLAVSAAFVAVLEVLVRRYSFAYRRPLLVSLAAIILLVLTGGIMIARTSFHRGLLRQAEERRLPLGEFLYRGYGRPRLRNIHPGMVTELIEGGFFMQSRRGESLRVMVNPETRFPFGIDFAEGDAVVVFGERDDGTVRAQGIRSMPHGADEMPMEGMRLFRRPHPRMFGAPLFIQNER